MNITIGDLDYYFAKDKRNIVNTEAQKIASYHRQKGDKINFVQKELDITRPTDLYYLFKDNDKTPNPPLRFFSDPKVRWCGKAITYRRYQIPDVVLACRPDYLLYPNAQTRDERAERVRLIGNNKKLLPKVQDWSNTFTKKNCIITDTLGECDEQTIIDALKIIQTLKFISFAEPIFIDKIRRYPAIEDLFMQLPFSVVSDVKGLRVRLTGAKEQLEGINKFKTNYPRVPLNPLEIYVSLSDQRVIAAEQFKYIKELIIYAKSHKIPIKIIAPKRTKTRYFFLIETIEDGTDYDFKMSGLEFISLKFKVRKNLHYGVSDGNNPESGTPLFRDALRQTYQDHEFLLLEGGDKKLSELNVSFDLGDEAFKLGI